MSTKKKFSIAPDLAKGLRSTVQSATTNQGQLHYDMMPLNMIELDPENPRKLSITREDIKNGLNESDPAYKRKKTELEALQELSESIMRLGVRNAVEVYKEGEKYRIISGERRYLACVLNGEQSIPVRINPKPDEFKLRYMQWVENINRQDLSLKEKYINLVAMAKAYQEKTNHNMEITDKTLQEWLGVSNSHAYRYFCLLRADKKIIDLVNDGKLNNLKLVQELVSMKDKGAREQILSWILSSKTEVTSLSTYKKVAGKKAMTSNAIHFGKTNNDKVAKLIIHILLTHPALTHWKERFALEGIEIPSVKSLGKVFQAIVTLMERECGSSG